MCCKFSCLPQELDAMDEDEFALIWEMMRIEDEAARIGTLSSQ